MFQWSRYIDDVTGYVFIKFPISFITIYTVLNNKGGIYGHAIEGEYWLIPPSLSVTGFELYNMKTEINMNLTISIGK